MTSLKWALQQIETKIQFKKFLMFQDSNNWIIPLILMSMGQLAKKVVSDSPELADFAIGPVNFFLNLPIEQLKCFREFKLQKNCNQSCYIVIRKFVWASHK